MNSSSFGRINHTLGCALNNMSIRFQKRLRCLRSIFGCSRDQRSEQILETQLITILFKFDSWFSGRQAGEIRSLAIVVMVAQEVLPRLTKVGVGYFVSGPSSDTFCVWKNDWHFCYSL